MHTTLQHSFNLPAERRLDHPSLWSSFISWCEGQQKNCFLWLAIGLVGHGCFLTPLTLMVIMLTGNSILFWALAIAAIAMVLVSNLAALPTKITLPVLFLSLFIDLVVMMSAIALLFAN